MMERGLQAMHHVRRCAFSAVAFSVAALIALLAAIMPADTSSVTAASSQAPRAGWQSSVPHLQAPEPAGDLLWLEQQMAWAIEQYWAPGQYAVAVTDLQTGETVSVNGDQPHLSGCVINLFALYEVVRDLWLARYPQSSVESLIAETIWGSNATTAYQLYGVLGGGDVVEGVRRVDHLIREELGLTGVTLDHPPAYGESIGVNPDNWVTALATNQALALLWDGQVIPEPSWRAFLLYYMTQVKPGLNYLTAAVPAVVSHKNGFLWTSIGWVDNDIGIVRLQRDGVEYAYAISFFSQGVANEYDDIPLGQRLGDLAYQVMAARYLY